MSRTLQTLQMLQRLYSSNVMRHVYQHTPTSPHPHPLPRQANLEIAARRASRDYSLDQTPRHTEEEVDRLSGPGLSTPTHVGGGLSSPAAIEHVLPSPAQTLQSLVASVPTSERLLAEGRRGG